MSTSTASEWITLNLLLVVSIGDTWAEVNNRAPNDHDRRVRLLRTHIRGPSAPLWLLEVISQ